MAEIVTRLGQGGRVVLPAAYRRALGLEPGDRVVLVLREGEREIAVLSPAQALERAREMVARHVPKGRSLAGELIRDRRREARSEAKHGAKR